MHIRSHTGARSKLRAGGKAKSSKTVGHGLQGGLSWGCVVGPGQRAEESVLLLHQTMAAFLTRLKPKAQVEGCTLQRVHVGEVGTSPAHFPAPPRSPAPPARPPAPPHALPRACSLDPRGAPLSLRYPGSLSHLCVSLSTRSRPLPQRQRRA